jgi:uncharacterized membrane protein
MKKWASRNILYIIGAIAGGIAGYCYYKLIGCTSGTCRITSSPVNSTLYCAVMGALFLGIFKKDTSAREKAGGVEE